MQVCWVIFVSDVRADFAGRFSLSLGEQYSDNILFQNPKVEDFATVIRPTFSLLYAPPGQTIPIFKADLTPEGQIFAQHPRESNFGSNLTFTTEYTYYSSPKFTLYLSDGLARLGKMRSGEDGFSGQFGGGTRGTILPPSGGGTGGPPVLQGFDNSVVQGNEIRNQISLRGSYLYNPYLSVSGDYAFGYGRYLDAGGTDLWHRAGGRGIYKWGPEHNLFLGYGADIIKTRDGSQNIIHNIDIGDDYFSSLKLNLDPTLTVLASSGLGITTGSGSSGKGGGALASRFNVTVTKLWQTATLSAGVNRGITPSLGVAGVSNTTSFVTNFNIRFTELLSAFIRSNFSIYDTADGSFKTFNAGTGLRYRILSWLSSDLRYAHRWESGAGSSATSTNFVQKGGINSNTVALAFTADFDVWPTPGFARAPALP